MYNSKQNISYYMWYLDRHKIILTGLVGVIEEQNWIYSFCNKQSDGITQYLVVHNRTTKSRISIHLPFSFTKCSCCIIYKSVGMALYDLVPSIRFILDIHLWSYFIFQKTKIRMYACMHEAIVHTYVTNGNNFFKCVNLRYISYVHTYADDILF